MTKLKARVCTALLIVVVLGAMTGAMFVYSDKINMNLTWFVGGLIGYWHIGGWVQKFYKWLLEDNKTK